MKNMNIASVKLVNDGLKGVVVTYSTTSTKGGRSFIDEHTSRKKAPIHQELETAFESLREHLLVICGYSKQYLGEVIITSVTYNDKGFIIVGKKTILEGDKTINLVTPLLNDDSYSEFDAVSKILDTIYLETEDYMSGAKVFSDAQLVMRFNQDKEDFDVETFKGLSAEEQRGLATKILEDMGHLVLLSDEQVLDGPTGTNGRFHPAGELSKKDEEKLWDAEPISTKDSGIVVGEPAMNIVNDDDDDFDLPVVKAEKTPKKSALTLVKGEEGHFTIVAPEPKQSTAKRKQG
jgi:hypothetical protein